MFVPRPTSPLSFEPLSTSPEDAFGSDSDNELDEGARAAKRRRIEQLGKSYLEGKQLFILSAGLKGPFDGDWKNPWKRSASRRKKGVTQEKETPNSGVIPESVPRAGEGKLSTATPFSPATPHISDSEVGLRRGFSESRQSSVSHVITSRYFAKPARPTASAAASNRNAMGPKNTDTNWLKKGKAKLDHRAINSRKSPSPTPAYRPGSRQRSDGEPAETRETNTSSREIIYERRISGFTPVNAPAKHAAPPPPPPVPEKPVQKPRKPREKATTEKDGDQFSKPLAPASAQRGGRRGGGGRGGKKKQPTPAPAENDTDRRGSLHIAPPAAHLPEFEYYRTKKSKYLDTVLNDEGPPPAQDTQSTEAQSSHTQSFEKSRQTVEKSGTDAAMPEKTANSKSNPSAQNSHDPAITAESDHITSAQVVPHPTRSDLAFSLNYTDAALSAENTAESPHDTSDDGFSTQAAVAHAQKTLQDDLVSPEKATPARTDRAQTPLQITPFHMFQTPSRGAARNARQSTGGQPTSTQAILNAISPFDLSTVKKTHPVAPHEGEGEGDDTVIGPKQKAVSFESPTESRNKSGPANTTSTSQQSHRSWDDVVGLPTRRPSISNPPKPSEGKDTSARSTGTALPWPPSASTGGTKPQDGQGHDWLDNFDFNGAFAEAGSFLRQSFEYEQDLSFSSRSQLGAGASAATG